MTTNIGVKAFDPNYQQNYVLLVADSQATWDDAGSERFAYNSKKIHLNKGKNFMFAHAGTTYNLRREYAPILKTKKVIGSQDLIKIFSEIKEQGFKDNTCICAQNKEGIFSLFKLLGNYLVDVEYLYTGSGKEFIQKSMDNIWNFSKCKNGKRIIVCPWAEMIPFCFGVLKEASGKDKDKYTGGHMDFGVMTSKGSFIYYNFAPLDKNISKEDIMKSLKKKNLEEKLFN